MPGFITDENGNLIEFTGAKVKSELLSYDLIIRTQNEFDNFCNSVTNGTCTARSVLFVGDGGTFEFVKADGLAIDLLSTNIKKISGIKNAIINIQAEGKSSIYGLRVEADVDNITLKISGARIIMGFTKFTSATNLTFIGQSSDTNSGPCIGFEQCNNITNCYADCTSPTSYARGYRNCTNIVNSKGVISSPLSKNSTSSMSSVFSGSTNLSNVEAIINEDTPNAYGFFDCENISNYSCTHGETYLGDTLDCTNISALADASNLTEENVASWQEKLGCERNEVVYDMTSSDSNFNWGYTSGISAGNTGITVSGKDFSKYKKLKFYFKGLWGKTNGTPVYNEVLEIDFENIVIIDGFYSVSNNSFSEYLQTLYTHSTYVSVNSTKTSIRLGSWQNCTSGSDLSKNIANGTCHKIIGVY